MKTNQKSGMAKPTAAAKFDPLKKAKKAFANAEQRCNNPKDPSYANYGAAGIKMLFKSAAEMIADIGLPKSADLSLDRINPKGHYEPGNVRWANKAVQAANKKKSSGGSTLTVAQHIAKVEAVAAQPAERLLVARMWDCTIGMLNTGYLSAERAQWFDEHANVAGQFHWSFDTSDPRDLSELPGAFRLVSLTTPGSVRTLRGGPILPRLEADTPVALRQRIETAIKQGVIYWMGKEEMLLNVSPTVLGWMQPDLTGEKLGAFWHGLPPAAARDGAGVEGSMLSIASYLAKKRPVCFRPMAYVLAILADRRGYDDFDDSSHPLLLSGPVFIPDFQVSHTEGWEPDYAGWKDIARLLKYRAQRGYRTFLGIQDINKVPGFVREIILTTLTHRSLSGVKFPGHPPISSFAPSGDPRHYLQGGWDLTRMRQEGMCTMGFVELQPLH